MPVIEFFLSSILPLFSMTWQLLSKPILFFSMFPMLPCSGARSLLRHTNALSGCMNARTIALPLDPPASHLAHPHPARHPSPPTRPDPPPPGGGARRAARNYRILYLLMCLFLYLWMSAWFDTRACTWLCPCCSTCLCPVENNFQHLKPPHAK